MSLAASFATAPKRDAILPVTLTIFVALLAVAVLGGLIAPYDPLATDAARQLMAPSLAHPCGTDQVGRDICARLITATRLDLTIGVGAAGLALVFGSIIGGLAGYFGGWADRIAMWIIDTIMAFPLFVLAMGIVAALGNSFANIIYATAIVNIPFYARTARTEMSQRRAAGFVEAARVGGNRPLRILAVHLFPCTVPSLMVQTSLTMGWAILNAASLSFIGLGIRPPTPEWGIMVAEGASYIISGEWWVSIMPGLVLVLVVLAFNLLGDSLRDRFDIRERR